MSHIIDGNVAANNLIQNSGFNLRNTLDTVQSRIAILNNKIVKKYKLSSSSSTNSPTTSPTTSMATSPTTSPTTSMATLQMTLPIERLSAPTTDTTPVISPPQIPDSPQLILNGLVNYWTFDGNTDDFSYGVSISGSFDYVTDRKGIANSALDVNFQYAILPNCDRRVLSVSLWVYLTQVVFGWQTIFEVSGLSLTNGFGIFYYLDHSLRFEVDYSDPVNNPVTNSTFTNRWTHIATTFDSPRADLYVNGALNKTSYIDVRYLTSRNCTLGSIDRTWTVSRYVDDVFFYNRVLSGDEVQRIMQINS